jgi:hypothetical protein
MAIAANLLTPRIQAFWAESSIKRATNGMARLRAELSLMDHPEYSSILQMEHRLHLAMAALCLSFGAALEKIQPLPSPWQKSAQLLSL